MSKNVIEDFNPDNEAFNFDEINPLEDDSREEPGIGPKEKKKSPGYEKPVGKKAVRIQSQSEDSMCSFPVMCYLDRKTFEILELYALKNRVSVSSVLRPEIVRFADKHSSELTKADWEMYNTYHKR